MLIHSDDLSFLPDILSPLSSPISSQETPEINTIDKKVSKLQRMLPLISVSIQDFNQSKIKFMKYLHLFNEELRLSKICSNLHQDLTFFLVNYSMLVKETNQEIYTEYYLKLLPESMRKLKRSPILKHIFEMHSVCSENPLISQSTQYQSQSLFFNETLHSQVFDSVEMIKSILQRKAQSPCVPLLFDQTAKIFRILGFLFQRTDFMTKEGNKNSIQTEKDMEHFGLQHPEMAIMSGTIFLLLQKSSDLKQFHEDFYLYSLNGTSTFNKIFKFFCEYKMDISEIDDLIDGISFIYKGLLRIIKKECHWMGQELGDFGWKLLEREDMSLNGRRVIADSLKRSFLGLDKDLMFSGEGTMLETNRKTSLQPSAGKNFKSSIGGSRQSLAKPVHSGEVMQTVKLQGDLSKNLNYTKKDVLFKEIYKVFEVSDEFRIRSKELDAMIRDEPLTEEKVQNEVQEILKWDIFSRLSTFVGRGSLDFNTEEMNLTEVVEIPKISITGKIKQNSAKVTYVFDKENPGNLEQMSWAEFHNGVAVGLQISRKALESLDKQGVRTWIDYQKTEYKRYDHAGLMFGLGLQGLFNCFTIADIYFNLRTCNDSRIISTILGLATSKLPANRINMSEIILKAFNLHLEFNYSTASEVKISRIVQSAAMISIGLYHKGMSKKSLSETMLYQIEARPFNENNKDRECHSLCAGFALGIINLSKGSNIPSIKEMKLDERLLQYIEGGTFSEELPRALDNLGRPDYQSSNLLESKSINTQMTAPSALMALTLIHLKSENKSIANRIKVPGTMFDIINCNPCLCLLKVLCRNLVLWKEIQPTKAFLLTQIPSIVRFLLENDHQSISDKFYLNSNFANLDYHNLSLIYYNILAGSCMAMAFKYAGSGDAQVRDLIMDTINTVLKVEILENEFLTGRTSKNKLDRYSQLSILSVLGLSLSIVCAGYCDLKAFKMLKLLKRKIKGCHDFDAVYGFDMAIHMSIGFLFLGNGTYTFGNSDFQILCLLLSTFPVFPCSINDNRFHLQALRHFYVLAIQENLFHLIDIDTKKPLKLAVELQTVSSNGMLTKHKMISPLFLNSSDAWKNLKLLDDEYHRLVYNFPSSESQRFTRPKFLFVKKKYSYSVELKNFKDFVLSKLPFREFENSSHFCASK